jgi:hypothetical protein
VPVPVASILQIMNGIMQPNAQAVYDSVGTIVGVEGVKEIAPANDEEWAALANNAAALVESGNLMLLEGRMVDTGDWVKMTRAFMDASVKALKAAEAKSTDGILDAGAGIYQTCESCHERYAQ